eukprot:gene20348-biopygen5574
MSLARGEREQLLVVKVGLRGQRLHSHDEDEELVVADAAAKGGARGYEGIPSPHTPHPTPPSSPNPRPIDVHSWGGTQWDFGTSTC